MSEVNYSINFLTNNEATFLGLNDKKLYMDYEENLIENYNFQGFVEQLMAVWYGFTEMDIEEDKP